MLDFNKEETSQKTMTANVILTFDTLINEFGTQEILDIEFAIAYTGDETVFNMLSAINEYVDCHNLPKKKLWKISTAANWTEFANKTGVDIDLIEETNGKWQFRFNSHMTEFEQLLENKFDFGRDVFDPIDPFQKEETGTFEHLFDVEATQKYNCGYELSCKLADAENNSSELSSNELCEFKIQILNKYTQDAFDEYCDAYKEQFSKLPLSIEDYQRLQRFYLKNNKS